MTQNSSIKAARGLLRYDKDQSHDDPASGRNDMGSAGTVRFREAMANVMAACGLPRWAVQVMDPRAIGVKDE